MVTLLDAGYTTETLGNDNVNTIRNTLTRNLGNNGGLAGFGKILRITILAILLFSTTLGIG